MKQYGVTLPVHTSEHTCSVELDTLLEQLRYAGVIDYDGESITVWLDNHGAARRSKDRMRSFGLKSKMIER